MVVVNFGSYKLEIVPAFRLQTPGQYLMCDTNNGGQFATTEPGAEVAALNVGDLASKGNLRRLIRMLKAWKKYCSVPIKSFHLELLATEFMAQCEWRAEGFFYFDWIVRDFFRFMTGRANGYVFVPGTYEAMHLGDGWLSRAQSAYARAAKAADYERDNYVGLAGDEWQKIFGTGIPKGA